MKFRKPEPIPSIFIIFATLVLLTLSGWQFDRLQWKNSLVKNIEAAQAMPPLTRIEENPLYRKVEFSGRLVNEKSFHLVGRTQGSSQGFYILTPLKMWDGKAILINRGWAPQDAKISTPAIANIKGVIRPTREKRYFSPENNPEKNVWFYENIEAMSKISGMKLAPFVVEEVGNVQKDVYPQPGDGKISLRNDHLGYAITWFALAVIGLLMFVFYHRVEEKR